MDALAQLPATVQRNIAERAKAGEEVGARLQVERSNTSKGQKIKDWPRSPLYHIAAIEDSARRLEPLQARHFFMCLRRGIDQLERKTTHMSTEIQFSEID